ncbi:AbrB/MazE/SpoVT family DNA-binding domain-containing protein [Candidatus Woesearchaeota archaeon]|nr:AbrB/MazE/SpoVT family DNA-binding domain-containing protein [Candidatus Woesearchaeota archaeon]
METAKVKLRKWGNSLGTTIPKEVIDRESLKEGDTVELTITKPKNVLKELFGALKGKEKIKISTEELMKEIDKELYND